TCRALRPRATGGEKAVAPAFPRGLARLLGALAVSGAAGTARVSGAVDIEGVGELGYTLAYLFGLTPTSPNGTVVWRFEFDRRF
ncbi:MAG TPA: hypothetical protein VJO12_04895, partial [Stellaceae bacterium]|nr:hypothetical protein [Stellaceae bacterium]